MAGTFRTTNTIWIDPDGTIHQQDVGPTGAGRLATYLQEIPIDPLHTYYNPIPPTTEFNGVAGHSEYCIHPPVTADAVWLSMNTGTKALNVWTHIATLV